jgi:Spy/CpxP family protein refolding chaperone
MRPFRQPGELPRPFARLDLTEEQRTRIVEIFESGRPRADSVLQELMPYLAEINESIQADIRDVLTPEQAEMLEEELGRGGMRPGGMDRRWMRPFLPDSPPAGGMRPRRPGG